MSIEGLKIDNIGKAHSFARGCVVAVGSFDGVHKGHRELLSLLSELGREYNAPTAVFTFDVKDNPKKQTNRLATELQKKELLAQAGVDMLVSAPFSKCKDMDAESFISEILLDLMGARAVVCGYDFRFGRDRLGDMELLQRVLGPMGIPVKEAPVYYYNEAPVSSTAVRSLVSRGDMVAAGAMLGRNYSFSAEIIKGRQLGRTLGFPTANQLFPKELCIPPFGVYAVRCTLDGAVYNGIANLGVKPTVGAEPSPLCETYLFGFDGDVYGREMKVEFLRFIRAEKRFSSVDALKEQVLTDIESVCSIFNQGELI